MWPGGVTFGIIGWSFLGNVSNCWLNSYGKFGGATRHRFFAICEKPEGTDNRPPPPGRARVKSGGHVSPVLECKGETMKDAVSICMPRFYILGTAELIVLQFVTWAETDMICGFDKAMGASVHVRMRTLRLFFRVLAWIEWFKVDDCGISRGNF